MQLMIAEAHKAIPVAHARAERALWIRTLITSGLFLVSLWLFTLARSINEAGDPWSVWWWLAGLTFIALFLQIVMMVRLACRIMIHGLVPYYLGTTWFWVAEMIVRIAHGIITDPNAMAALAEGMQAAMIISDASAAMAAHEQTAPAKKPKRGRAAPAE